MIVSVPAAAGVVAIWATPSLSVAVPRTVVPSSKVTVPVGTPPPSFSRSTVAWSVTDWPKVGAEDDADTPIWVGLLAAVTSIELVVCDPAMALSVTVRV